MKKTAFMISLLTLFFCFSFEANAQDVWYGEIFDALSDDTVKLLEEFGISEKLSEDFTEISPERALKTVLSMFIQGMSLPMKSVGICISLLFILSVITSFLPDLPSFQMMGKSIALMCMMFSVISVSGKVFSECASSLLATKDFMLVLIPVFAGIVSFSGNPSLALSFNTVAFSFGELVAVLFGNTVPLLSGVMISVSAAGAISPVMRLNGIGKVVSRVLNLFMAFIAGIFVAVMSVRGVIAGAADTVAIRGVRFLIGNTVPVVGSAIGEALNSIVASFSLIKHTAGMLGIMAVIVINLPSLINLLLWKLSLYFIAFCAEITDCNEIKDFCENMNRVLSVMTAALLFVAFVFVICIAILITVGKE